MSSIIAFLEELGKNAQLRDAAVADLEDVMIVSAIDPEVRAAILAEDQKRLEVLLGASTNVCCMVRTPEHDDESEHGEDADTIRQSA